MPDGGTFTIATADGSMDEQFIATNGYGTIGRDGQDAVEKFTARTGEIDLVISDVVMPRKSGKAASEEIRQMSDRVKFIFVSGHANDVILREGGFSADVEIITKPILPYELLKCIRARLCL